MALVEDHARLLVLGVVRGAGLLVALQRRLDLRRELRAEPVRLGDEVRKRGRGVREHEGAQPAWLGECVLLAEEPAPRRAEHVVPAGDSERVDEVVELADEQVDGPEVAVPPLVVRRSAVADLVVEHHGAVVGEVGQRQQVVVRRAGPPVERHERGGAVGTELAVDPVPGLGGLVVVAERNGPFAHAGRTLREAARSQFI